MNFTIAILAGGKSSRMGKNKALLKIGELTLIEHVIQSTKTLSPREIIIITNTPDDYQHLGYRMIADTILGQGAIGGIITALHHSQTEATLIMACDMPFIQPALLQLMLEQYENNDTLAVIPTVDSYPQGVLALYSRDCLPHFESVIASNHRKLKTIFDELSNIRYLDESIWQTVDAKGLSFMNINTPEELQSARQMHTKIHKN